MTARFSHIENLDRGPNVVTSAVSGVVELTSGGLFKVIEFQSEIELRPGEKDVAIEHIMDKAKKYMKL